MGSKGDNHDRRAYIPNILSSVSRCYIVKERSQNQTIKYENGKWTFPSILLSPPFVFVYLSFYIFGYMRCCYAVAIREFI